MRIVATHFFEKYMCRLRPRRNGGLSHDKSEKSISNNAGVSVDTAGSYRVR